MGCRLLLRTAPGRALQDDEKVRIELESPRRIVSLGSLTPGLRTALRTLIVEGAEEAELALRVVDEDGESSLPQLYLLLQRLLAAGALRYCVMAGDAPVLTVEPFSNAFRLGAVDAHQRYMLSRFAYCRQLEGALVMESPLAAGRAILQNSTGRRLFGELACARTAPELNAAIPGTELDVAHWSLSLLAAVKLVCNAGSESNGVEGGNEALEQWEFHDLLFHAASRPGRIGRPAGATYRFLGRIPPQPVVKPPMASEPLPLFRPELESLVERDVPLARVMEERSSIRAQGDDPITAEQVGEFLYRTARVRGITEPGANAPRRYAFSSRPYPGGGAAYELEIYPNVTACRGIDAGLYHYEPVEHGLSRVSDPSPQAEALIRGAMAATGTETRPQVLLHLAARFQRLSWKYETIAYAAVLKNVGVLYQTMYLVATAMGLAPCALGSGNSELFAKATGLSYFEESSVGEFMLGSRRA